MSILVDLSNIDWVLLRQQKMRLVELEVHKGLQRTYKSAITGILNLLDHIQDEAEILVGTIPVFGEDNNETEDEEHT